MVTGFNIPIWSQRDPHWATQRLGIIDGTTIGGQGCLITSIAMMNAGFDPGNQLNPSQVDNLFTAQGGYANGNLVIWTAINRILPNCALTGTISCAATAAPVQDLINHLEQQYLTILQVGFGGDPKQMHFVLAYGHNGNDIMFHDPWYGDASSFATSKRYGTGDSSKDILAIHYFGDAIANTSVKVDAPIAKAAVTAPAYNLQPQSGKVTITKVAPEHLNLHSQPTSNSSIVANASEGNTLDYVGIVVNGEVINGTPNWYMNSANQYWSMNYTVPYIPPVAQPTISVPVAPILPTTSSVPEWVSTYYNKPETRETLLDCQALDVTTNAAVAQVPKGMLVNIAGYFQYQGKTWARSVWAKTNNKWNGVDTHNLDSPVTSVPVKVLPAASKAIMGTPIDDVEEDFFGPLEELERAPLTAWDHLKEFFAITFAPLLKFLGKKGNQ